MNTSKLEYIIEVAKVHSLAIAAKNLNISQSALSQSITQFEKELGVILFTRTKKSTIPTIQGKKLIFKGMEILERVQEFYDTANSYTEMSGKLRIAAIPGVMPPLVRAVAEYKKTHTNLTISIVERSTEEILEDVRQNKLETGLIALSDKYRNEIDGLIFEPIDSGEIIAIVNKDSVLANKSYITPSEMIQESFVLYNDEYIQEFICDFTETFGRINVMFTTDNSDAIRSFILGNLGITVGHNYSLVFDPYVHKKELIILPIKDYPQTTVQFGWIRAENIHMSLSTKQFINRYNLEHQWYVNSSNS